MIPDDADPRDIAWLIELACLRAELHHGGQQGPTVELSTLDAYRIAELLRRVPLRKGRPPLTLMERGHFEKLIEKARAQKARLMAEGKNATEAEGEAAEWIARGGELSPETYLRAMQNRPGK